MKHWIEAFRLRTLPLALSSIIFGAALAVRVDQFEVVTFALCVLTTVLLQILSNLANDYGDYQKGTDNDQRVGPERAVQSGAITSSQMKSAMYLFAGFSLVSGSALLLYAFEWEQLKMIGLFFLIGLLAIWASINYTAGKVAYGYRALGDVFVFIFFGLVGVLGSAFLFTKSFETIDILPASACGLMAVGVLNLNNTRDIVNDKASGKTTIPVLIGLKGAKIYQAVLIELSYWLFIAYAFLLDEKGVYLVLLTSVIILKSAKTFKDGEGRELDPLLKVMALTSFFSSLLFMAGVIFF